MKNRPRETPIPTDFGGFVKFVEVAKNRVSSWEEYPYAIPAVRNMGRLNLDPKLTFLIGENGSGKSTIIEALAVAAGFNAEGGSKNFSFATKRSDSPLHDALTICRGPYRERDGFFLRAEGMYNTATEIDRIQEEDGRMLASYGGVSLHEQSHGESFMATIQNRFFGTGLYVLDEPESALSPARQLRLLKLIHSLVETKKSQFVIATHSPILMAYPNALIYNLSADGVAPIAYEETEHYRLTRDFLNSPRVFLHHLLTPTED